MLNDVELTILSLVAESPRFGEEIEQVIERRGLREWLTVGSVSLYYVLGRLEHQELLSHSLRKGANGMVRTVYQITDAGRGVIQTAVADLLGQPRPLNGGFALGLANIGVLKPQVAYRALRQQRDSLKHQLETAEALWTRRLSEETPSEGTRALYTHGIAIMQAELAWLDDFIANWHVTHPAVESDETGETERAAPTEMHHPTRDADRGKKIQKLKPPGEA